MMKGMPGGIVRIFGGLVAYWVLAIGGEVAASCTWAERVGEARSDLSSLRRWSVTLRKCPLSPREYPLSLREFPLSLRAYPLLLRGCPLSLRAYPLSLRAYPLLLRGCPRR